LLEQQNNYVECLSIDDNVAKSFNVLAANLSYIIILMVQTILFSDLFLVKLLDTSAKPFFPYTYIDAA